MHPYEQISLQAAGIFLALFIIGLHLWMLLKQEDAMQFCKKFARNYMAGAILTGIGIFWFWLLVMPDGYTPLSMELNDFNKVKPILMIILPIGGYLAITQMKEFIAVRGLGLCKLMVAAPLLAAAWQEPGTMKVLIPLYAYALIFTGMFWVGMPGGLVLFFSLFFW